MILISKLFPDEYKQRGRSCHLKLRTSRINFELFLPNTRLRDIDKKFCVDYGVWLQSEYLNPQEKVIAQSTAFPYFRMSKSEVMLIIILFHCSGYRCMKHFYLEKVCKGIRNLFPAVVSYYRFVELQKDVAVPLAIFIKKVLLGRCTGISFADSTPLRVCRNQRIHIHKVFLGMAKRDKCSMG